MGHGQSDKTVSNVSETEICVRGSEREARERRGGGEVDSAME